MGYPTSTELCEACVTLAWVLEVSAGQLITRARFELRLDQPADQRLSVREIESRRVRCIFCALVYDSLRPAGVIQDGHFSEYSARHLTDFRDRPMALQGLIEATVDCISQA
jgi:hypothetical protein